MKKYRKVVADAYAWSYVLDAISDRVDFNANLAEEYKNRAAKSLSENNCPDTYFMEQVEEYTEKSAAFERLLNSFSCVKD